MLSSVPFLSSRSPCLVQQQIPLFHYQNDVSFRCHYCASSNLLRNSGKKSRSLVLFKAGLWDYMRSSLSNINTSPVSERPSEMEDEDIVEEYEPEEIVLDEKEQENGMLEKIVFISGKEVDINDVQKLCSKVFLLVEFIPERIGRLAKEAYCKNFNSTQEQLYGSYLIFNKSVSSHRNKMVLCWALLFQLDGEIQRVLIGMARATSDHVFNATIWDVVVDPLYQGRGLGKALIQQMIHTLLKRDIANITLFSDAQVVDFYRNLGFEADAGGVRGMFWYPKL